MAKQPKKSFQSGKLAKKQHQALLSLLILVSLSKIIWLWNQPDHMLLGSDGENYFSGLEGLVKYGLLSQSGTLHYWPAGYPILMWPLAEFSTTYFPFFVGVLQILIYSFATYYFATQLQSSTFGKIFWPAVLIISFNPMLALNASAIGYEVNAAASFLIALGAFLKFAKRQEKSLRSPEIWYASLALALATFMQPRISLLAFSFFLIWALASFKRGVALFMIASTSAVVALGPIIMIGRNVLANDFVAISTNLGVTMNIGAGPKSTGGYTNQTTGVPCPPIEGDAAAQDSHKVRCVLNWYKDNPSLGAGLFLRKFTYHFSPWFGPLANGTTARSPWLDIHPFKSTAQSQEGFNMVYGNTGKLFSWGWMLGSFALMIWGFIALWRLKGQGQVLAALLLAPTLLNAFSSMITIGDNRFRMPTMTLSILLQLFGTYALLSKKSFKRWALVEPKPSWPGLNWKKKAEIDNLPS
jgi:hypothetical protein